MTRSLFIFVILAVSVGPGKSDTNVPTASPLPSTNDWLFIDNGQVRLGVKKSSGAGIAYFSESDSSRNLVNHHDRGRLIQQSYYGDPDGSLWNKTPWRWNPVQGGDWHGNPAKVLELKSTAHSIYAKTEAKHWASGAALPEVCFEQWISLTNAMAHVQFKMTYSGTNSHRPADQEIPAIFLAPDLDTLVLYVGEKPWSNDVLHRSRPGWPNEKRRMTEHWAAYVNTNDWGIGFCVPVANELTCYRFGDGDEKHGSCSYFAPLGHFAVKPGTLFSYDVWITIGKTREIRERFARLQKPK
ncbi:MAG: hypothetical protein ABIP71_07500 [Verrucomicrobiota bacterium]